MNPYKVFTIFFTTLILLTPCVFQTLNADTINVTNVTGTWSNAQGSSGPPTNFNGGGTNVIHWGSGSPQSGYAFNGLAPPTIMNVPLDTPFALGTFTHFNYPISGSSLTSVDLGINILLNINNTPATFSGTYHFLHDETPNNAFPVTNPLNNDIVTFQNNIAQLGTIMIGNIAYTVGLVGFKTSPNGSLIQQFSTVETQQNDATLFAQISLPEVFVPEPSTYLILGSILALSMFVAYKRRQQKVQA